LVASVVGYVTERSDDTRIGVAVFDTTRCDFASVSCLAQFRCAGANWLSSRTEVANGAVTFGLRAHGSECAVSGSRITGCVFTSTGRLTFWSPGTAVRVGTIGVRSETKISTRSNSLAISRTGEVQSDATLIDANLGDAGVVEARQGIRDHTLLLDDVTVTLDARVILACVDAFALSGLRIALRNQARCGVIGVVTCNGVVNAAIDASLIRHAQVLGTGNFVREILVRTNKAGISICARRWVGSSIVYAVDERSANRIPAGRS